MSIHVTYSHTPNTVFVSIEHRPTGASIDITVPADRRQAAQLVDALVYEINPGVDAALAAVEQTRRAP